MGSHRKPEAARIGRRQRASVEIRDVLCPYLAGIRRETATTHGLGDGAYVPTSDRLSPNETTWKLTAEGVTGDVTGGLLGLPSPPWHAVSKTNVRLAMPIAAEWMKLFWIVVMVDSSNALLPSARALVHGSRRAIANSKSTS
jgi:hypothetical protein